MDVGKTLVADTLLYTVKATGNTVDHRSGFGCEERVAARTDRRIKESDQPGLAYARIRLEEKQSVE